MTRSNKSPRLTSFKARDGATYLGFFKPFDVLCQFSPEGDHKTLAAFGFPSNVYPVGRLDSDSEGLLILSDDTRLNSALLDPEQGHARTYWVQVDNIPEARALSELSSGVLIQGRRTRPCTAQALDGEPDLPERSTPIRVRKNIPTSWISLTLTEGKNRQVRRMTAAVGHPTLRLVRWAIGGFTLEDLGLAPGEWRNLSKVEVQNLFQQGARK